MTRLPSSPIYLLRVRCFIFRSSSSIRADKRVRDSLSTTARHAKRDEAATKGWMQRHMTALLAVADQLIAPFEKVVPSWAYALLSIAIIVARVVYQPKLASGDQSEPAKP